MKKIKLVKVGCFVFVLMLSVVMSSYAMNKKVLPGSNSTYKYRPEVHDVALLGDNVVSENYDDDDAPKPFKPYTKICIKPEPENLGDMLYYQRDMNGNLIDEHTLYLENEISELMELGDSLRKAVKHAGNGEVLESLVAQINNVVYTLELRRGLLNSIKMSAKSWSGLYDTAKDAQDEDQ